MKKPFIYQGKRGRRQQLKQLLSKLKIELGLRAKRYGPLLDEAVKRLAQAIDEDIINQLKAGAFDEPGGTS